MMTNIDSGIMAPVGEKKKIPADSAKATTPAASAGEASGFFI
jgi:hypothetical protein